MADAVAAEEVNQNDVVNDTQKIDETIQVSNEQANAIENQEGEIKDEKQEHQVHETFSKGENNVIEEKEGRNSESEKKEGDNDLQEDSDQIKDETFLSEEESEKQNLEENESQMAELADPSNTKMGLSSKSINPITATSNNSSALINPPDTEVTEISEIKDVDVGNDKAGIQDELANEETVIEDFDEDEYVGQPIYDRDQILAQYRETLEQRSRLQNLNQQYQNKLVEYFKKKKQTDEKAPEIEKNVTDQEQRYLKYMLNLEELEASESKQAALIESQLRELKDKCEEKQDKIKQSSEEFEKFKYEVGKSAINSRSGKPLLQKDLDQYQLFESKKEQEVIAVRLENIKLKNRLKKRELQLKAKEELAEGLHLIDFEQLKIENQTYNEKIEERNEELLKLRKKITTTVQVLTHLKEKLQFVQGENTEQRRQLKEIDVTVAQRRDILTKLKQVRDGLRIDNTKLKHQSGLLGNEPLLRDFEERKDEGEELRQRLGKLKEEHVEINMNLNSLRKKIEKAKF